ncbi:MAG: hypothetical protein AAGA68_14095 [Pseudomonadota bacterium]
MLQVDRVFLRLLGVPLQRRLLPALAALLLSVGLADPMIDWSLLRAQLRAQSALASTVQIGVLSALWSVTVAAALAPAWSGASAPYLMRQPISSVRWVRYLLPSLALALFPIGALWWLMPLTTMPSLLALLCACAAMMVSGSAWRVYSAGIGLLAFLLSAVSTYCTLTSMPANTALALTSPALLPLACKGLQAQRGRERAAKDPDHRHLRDATPWRTVLRRDLLCLVRRAPGALRQLLLFTILASGFLVALRLNGGLSGRALFRAACVLQMLALLPLYSLLVSLQRHLGGELYRRHWPLCAAQRGASLFALGIIACAPSSAGLSFAGHTLGFTSLSVLLIFTATQVLVLIVLFTHATPRAETAHGWSLWLWLVHTIVACVLSPVAYGALASVLMLGLWHLTQRGLRRVAEHSAQGRLRAVTQ